MANGRVSPASENQEITCHSSFFYYYITGVVLSSPIAAPAWPKTYSVQGMLHLPYAEINEPFSGYFDANNKKSRVDYYNGKWNRDVV